VSDKASARLSSSALSSAVAAGSSRAHGAQQLARASARAPTARDQADERIDAAAAARQEREHTPMAGPARGVAPQIGGRKFLVCAITPSRDGVDGGLHFQDQSASPSTDNRPTVRRHNGPARAEYSPRDRQ
jgi:hypothetical protein